MHFRGILGFKPPKNFGRAAKCMRGIHVHGAPQSWGPYFEKLSPLPEFVATALCVDVFAAAL